MRQLLTASFLMFIITSLHAQHFEVQDFRYDASSMAARRHPRTDVNGDQCAIIKVRANVDGLLFDSNLGIVGEPVFEPGEVWLYVSPGERYLQFMREGVVTKDYRLPARPESGRVYILELLVRGEEDRLPDDRVWVTFRMNQDNVYIQTGEGAAIPSEGNISRHRMRKGESQVFRFIKQGFEEKQRWVEADDDKVLDIELVSGEPTTTLALSGWITIESEPAQAEVYLNEQRVGVTPYMGNHLAGDYSLRLMFPDYHDYTDSFELDEGGTVSLPSIEMKPRHGYWSISSDPQGAEVFVNNNRIGTTPVERRVISSGRHQVSLRKELYADHEETITIEDGDDKDLFFELEEAFGYLDISSSPSNATVFIDNDEVGHTPWREQMAAGSYYLRLTHERYSASHDRDVTVRVGETTERFYSLARNYEVVQIEAPGAAIYIDGDRMGSDRYEAELTPGSYELTARKDRHHDDARTINVRVGRPETIELSPQPREGGLSIVTTPFEARGARIYIDGERRQETTPHTIALLEGAYEVRVEKEGYLDASASIDIKEGLEKELAFEMLTFEGSINQQIGRRRTSKILFGTAAVVAAGAGGYFQYSSMQLQDDYTTATTDAMDIYDQMGRHQLYSYIAFGVAVPLGVMNLVRLGQQRRLDRQLDLALIPVDGGGFLTLRIGF